MDFSRLFCFNDYLFLMSWTSIHSSSTFKKEFEQMPTFPPSSKPIMHLVFLFKHSVINITEKWGGENAPWQSHKEFSLPCVCNCFDLFRLFRRAIYFVFFPVIFTTSYRVMPFYQSFISAIFLRMYNTNQTVLYIIGSEVECQKDKEKEEHRNSL